MLLRLSLAGAAGVMILCGYGLSLPAPAPQHVAAEGPRCTTVYPRGFKVAKGTKKRPLAICKTGDLDNTWRGCTLRYNT